MELLASGRDADIFDFAPGLVLRRSRSGRSIAHEARTMQYVAEHGYPVPRIEEVRADGSEIVMERIDGLSMVDQMTSPWKIPALLRQLADLHDELHEIPAPDWLPGMPDDGDRVLHLDLHPLNVMMAARGPVVIDWPNARRGDPMSDVALTYALILCGRIPLPRPIAAALNQIRRPFVDRSFARRYEGAAFERRVTEMAELKCFDTNMQPDELAALRALARRYAERSGKRAPG